jgi:hypothetical protein
VQTLAINDTALTPEPSHPLGTGFPENLTAIQTDLEINREPPQVRRPLSLWKDLSGITEPVDVSSPTPANELAIEDFVMRRPRKESYSDNGDDMLRHNPSQTSPRQVKSSGTDKSTSNEAVTNKGNKWVKFLDIGISCDSDESDDELAFCKPQWTNKTAKKV